VNVKEMARASSGTTAFGSASVACQLLEQITGSVYNI
jgi:hypothetical protein